MSLTSAPDLPTNRSPLSVGRLGIIGGSGLTRLKNFSAYVRERQFVARTPWGEPSGCLEFGRIAAREIVFLPRHGLNHHLPPHRINYRANLWALARIAQVTQIIAVCTSGGIRADLAPGVLALPDQIIDYTHGRAASFHDQANSQVVHVDFTQPYDENLRQRLIQAAAQCQVALNPGAVYAAVQGPRLETAAEVRRIERDGGDLIGMTGMPEAALARELEVAYAALCPLVNWAAGRADSANGVDLTAAAALQYRLVDDVLRIIAAYCEG